MTLIDHQNARRYVLERLRNELSPLFSYHSLYHTREEVMRSAETFGRKEDLPQDQADLLITAAAFHDVGYLIGPAEHETIGARIAREVLPTFGFTEDQVQLIESMILATHLPTKPVTHLEELLVDADLAVLGMADFLKRSADLRTERENAGTTYTDEEWYMSQVRFMERHHYFSQTAQAMYTEGKQRNLEALLGLLADSQHKQNVIGPH